MARARDTRRRRLGNTYDLKKGKNPSHEITLALLLRFDILPPCVLGRGNPFEPEREDRKGRRVKSFGTDVVLLSLPRLCRRRVLPTYLSSQIRAQPPKNSGGSKKEGCQSRRRLWKFIYELIFLLEPLLLDAVSDTYFETVWIRGDFEKSSRVKNKIGKRG